MSDPDDERISEGHRYFFSGIAGGYWSPTANKMLHETTRTNEPPAPLNFSIWWEGVFAIILGILTWRLIAWGGKYTDHYEALSGVHRWLAIYYHWFLRFFTVAWQVIVTSISTFGDWAGRAAGNPLIKSFTIAASIVIPLTIVVFALQAIWRRFPRVTRFLLASVLFMAYAPLVVFLAEWIAAQFK